MQKRYSKPVDPAAFAYSVGQQEQHEQLAAKSDRIWRAIMPQGNESVDVDCPCGYSEVRHHFGRYYRCLRCGHLMVRAVRSEDAVAEYYRTSAEYNSHYLAPEVLDIKLRSIYEPKAEYVRDRACERGLPDEPSVLDVGCGPGLFLSCCSWAGERHGVEPGEYSHDHFISDAALSTEFPDKQFDIVTAWVVLEHAVDPCALLRKIVACIKPGGLVVIEVPRADSVSTQYFSRPDVAVWRHATADHLHLFTDKSLMDALGRFGLNPVEAWYYGLDMLTLLASAGMDPAIAARSQAAVDVAEMCDAMVVSAIKEA